jgi:hypothetical protein
VHSKIYGTRSKGLGRDRSWPISQPVLPKSDDTPAPAADVPTLGGTLTRNSASASAAVTNFQGMSRRHRPGASPTLAWRWTTYDTACLYS